MKQEDVVIGETYSTKIGPNRYRVVVVAKVEPHGSHPWNRITRFIVRRASEDKPLPKPRTAAALRPLTGQHSHGI